MVTHNAIPSGPVGVPVWMINASIMESMVNSDQNTEPKMFGSAKKAYGDFCCVPRCSNQRGVWNVKIRRYLASCTLQVWYNLTKISFQGKLFNYFCVLV
jgi:hypothetical protein